MFCTVKNFTLISDLFIFYFPSFFIDKIFCQPKKNDNAYMSFTIDLSILQIFPNLVCCVLSYVYGFYRLFLVQINFTLPEKFDTYKPEQRSR